MKHKFLHFNGPRGDFYKNMFAKCPAGMLAKEAKKYESRIMMNKDGKSVEVTKLMAVMGLAVKCGEKIKVEISGIDEETAFEAMKDFFENNL